MGICHGTSMCWPLPATVIAARARSDQKVGGIVCLATQGSGHDDERRLLALVRPLDATLVPFDRRRRLRSAASVFRRLAADRPELVVVEGTGVAGVVPVMAARVAFGTRYVVSSGDAVTPFIAARHPSLRPLAGLYERAMYRLSAGFIGWTPYLVGRALTYGAPRGMTAPGWAPTPRPPAARRDELRKRLGIARDSIVYGIVGSLTWSHRHSYCYGAELVRALTMVSAPHVHVLIVGDGDGRPRLEREIAENGVGARVTLTGRVPREQVPDHLAAMDVASLPQSVDGVGAFRYTTKLPEYVTAGLPIVTGQLPLAYDLGGDWMWRLPGDAPWDDCYLGALASLMNELDAEQVRERAAAVPREHDAFDQAHQTTAVSCFIRDLVEHGTTGRA